MAIENFEESWNGHNGSEIEQFIKSKSISSIQLKPNPDNEDEVTLSFENGYGNEFTSVNIPKGGGNTGNIIDLKASINNGASYIPLNGNAELTYSFTAYSEDQPLGGYANIILKIEQSNSETVEVPTSIESGSSSTFDLKPYTNKESIVRVYVIASYVFPSSEDTTSKTVSTSFRVIDLSLSSTFSYETIQNSSTDIRFTLKGSGNREVTLYLDREQHSTNSTNSSNNTWTNVFNVRNLLAGYHNVQLVGEVGNFKSNSLYMDFFVDGSTEDLLGISTSYSDGRIYTSEDTITIEAKQYQPFSFDIIAYSPFGNSTVKVYINNNESGNLSITNGQKVTYTNTFQETGDVSIRLTSGTAVYEAVIHVAEGEVNISEQDDYELKLSPNGRSNSDPNRATWGEGTVFEGFNWKTDGWLDNTLILANGASITTGFKPFECTNASSTGLTIEIEYYVKTIMDRSLPLISCREAIGNSYKGICVYAEEACCYTGVTKPQESPEGGVTYVNTGVHISYASDMWIKAAFVIHNTSAGKCLMELYINGVRSKADIYAQGTNWNISKGITIDSEGADITVRNIRVYKRALEDFEILNNYIVDRTNIVEMKEINDRNQVLTAGKVDFRKLRDQKKGVMVFIRREGIHDINATYDKGEDFIMDKAYWYAPEGDNYGPDFVAENFNIRIQGTSSTTYARKNYRLYLGKKNMNNEDPKLTVEDVETTGSNNYYSMRPNSVPSNLFCLKCDYSDSSMVLNTGGAKLYDSIMRNLELLTPPQGNNVNSSIRQAIDGIPCDLFIATEDENYSDILYLGQYNFNNEKSKSSRIFGMEVDGMTFDCPMTLETLNNANPFCLFQSAGSAYDLNEEYQTEPSLKVQLENYFDAGFEFNYPEDKWWSESTAREEVGDVKYNANPSKYHPNTAQRNAIIRLMGWIYDCLTKPDNINFIGLSRFNLISDPSNPNYSNTDYGNNTTGWSAASKEKWVSQKFKDEINNYFDLGYLCTYYLITEYWGSVDQRAKNILWRTWDGEVWYPTFYDGDTAMGMRNDSTLAYNYDITRDTWDSDAKKYAYEGHDSWLWCLLLANFETELKDYAAALRAKNKLDFERMEAMFTEEQQNNWCETLYNKSGEFKYIIPQLEGVPSKSKETGIVDNNRIYQHIYALTGNRESQRTLFLRERGRLLDARYVIGEYNTDIITAYFNNSVNNLIKVTSNGVYSFATRLRNGTWITPPTEISDDDTIQLGNITTSGVNDPVSIYGASHIKKLDLTECAGNIHSNGFNLSNCSLLRELDASLQSPSGGGQFNVDGCSVLEKINVENLYGVSFLGLDTLTRLKEFNAGGTNLQFVNFAIGAPLESVVLPASLTTLRLIGHRYLDNTNVILEGTSNITGICITECPNYDALSLVNTLKDNLTNVRIDGFYGKVSLDFLLSFRNKGGYNTDGTQTTNYPAFVGEVWLDRVIDENELTALNNDYMDLIIHQCPFSHYWYDDTTYDPCNITNEDNKTGYAYIENQLDSKPENVSEESWLTEHPNGYITSGHISLLHDKCWPVKGRLVNKGTNSSPNYVMEMTKLSKDNFAIDINNNPVNLTDPNFEGYDIFLYIPRYWYKGVNDPQNSRKHFFLSSSDECPPVAEHKVLTLQNNTQETDDVVKFSGYQVTIENIAIRSGNEYTLTEDKMNTSLLTSNYTSYDCYKVKVKGWKMVRYPSVSHQYMCCVFTDGDNNIIRYHILTMQNYENSPADFIAEIGQYDFLEVPPEAEYLWFNASSNIFINSRFDTNTQVILSSSAELEAVEPDWVEHKPELIGIYNGSTRLLGDVIANRAEGLRSLNTKHAGYVINKTSCEEWVYNTNTGELIPQPSLPSQIYGTVVDFYNLARCRGKGYSVMPLESYKNFINLLYVYYGRRNFQNIYGRTWSEPFAPHTYQDMAPRNAGSVNRYWGIQTLFATNSFTVYDYACISSTTWETFVRSLKTVQSNTGNCRIAIVRQDKSVSYLYPKKIVQYSASPYNLYNDTVARVIWGKYCDLIVSSWTGQASSEKGYTSAQAYATQPAIVNGTSNNYSAYYGPISLSSLNTNNSGNTYGKLYRLAYQGPVEWTD